MRFSPSPKATLNPPSVPARPVVTVVPAVKAIADPVVTANAVAPAAKVVTVVPVSPATDRLTLQK